MLNKLIAPALVYLSVVSTCHADFGGRVVKVVDGDTVQVLENGKMVKVRLAGIDAPESRQAFGQASKKALIAEVAQRDVSVITDTTDRYGRYLGILMIGDRNINAEQVKNGMAWAYRYRGKATDGNMLKLERRARGEGIGLWADPDAIEPWKWRKGQR